MINKIWNKLYAFHFSLLDAWTSMITRFAWRLRGVRLGRSCMFYGHMRLFKTSKAHIQIGNQCHFRSRSTSNLIGIRNPCILSAHLPTSQLIIGDNCGFSGTVIGAFVEVKLGNHVRCGANTLITDSDWHPEDPRAGEPKPVHIGDHVWLGYGVTVLKGVTIGENSVIGAGSVVVSDIPSHVIAAGNPCKVIKAIEHG
ncbi:MAG: acyltransferase [Flavobacteriales bacterium]